MLKKVIILTILTSFLSACITSPKKHLKRSINNKNFDQKGFKGKKFPPLHN